MIHRNIDRETARGLKVLRQRIKQSKIPSRVLNEQILIASWNIRELGRKPRTAKAIHYIAEILSYFDLISIQGVSGDVKLLRQVSEILGPSWKLLFSSESEGARGNVEENAYVYDERAVTFTGLAAEAVAPPIHQKVNDKTEVIPSEQFWRKPYVASFRAGTFDFVLLSVHVQWGQAEDRVVELELIADWVEHYRKSGRIFGKDIILMGDFGIPKYNDKFYRAIAKNGLAAPKALLGVPGASKIKPIDRYDQIFYYPQHTGSLFAGRGGVLDFLRGGHEQLFRGMSLKEFTHQLSDHLPLWILVKTETTDEELDQILHGSGGKRVSQPEHDLLEVEAESEEGETGVPPAEEPALDAVRHGRLAHVTSDFPGDVPGKKDQLNLQREIDAFSFLLAAEYLQPPLAIGLFGDWGAGKTFFMEQMEKRVRDISNDARKEQEKGEKISFHSNIAQIRFNAWNFVDANLWASLVTRIFDGLAEHIRGKEEPLEQKRREIIAKLNRTQQLEKVAREEREVAKVAADRASERLQALEQQCQEAEQDLEKKRSSITLDSINAEEIGQLLSREGREALAKIQPIGRQIRDGKQMDEFIQQVKESFGILDRFGIVSSGQMQWRKLTLPALVTVLSVVIWYGVAEWSDKIHKVWAVFAPLLPGIPWATRALTSFNTYASRLEHDWNDSKGSKLEEKKREILTPVVRRLEWKLVEAESARQAHLLKQEGLVKAQRAVQELDPDRMFMNFIEAKAASEDYRSRLGLISQIREDLEDLTFLLQQDTDRREGRAKKPFWKSNGQAQESEEEQKQEQEKGRENKQESTSDIAWKASLPRIDRIILYIDDLDRCPPKRVAEVLQAVHLLLAFPLFVVVVGVDPRWLHRALEVHYPEFLSVTSEIKIEELEGTRERAATPRAYLEKIFQIPYVLPRIDERGFKQLVRNLAVAQERKAEDEARQQTQPASGELQTHQEPTPLDFGTEKATPKTPTVSEREITEEQATAEKEAALVQEEQPLIAQAEARQADSRRGDVEEQVLDIAVQAEGRTEEKQLDSKRAVKFDLRMQSRPLSEHEIKFMQSLYPLFRTPRSAKRLVNLYRLVRVTVPDPEEFAGGATDAGFRPTLMLLGIMIGFPEQGLELIDSLKREKNAREWWKFVETFRPLQERPRKKGQPPADKPTKHLARAVQTSDAVRPYYWSRGLNRGLGREEGRQWSELCECLDRIRKAQSSKFSIVLLKRWIDRVTRYSFQAAVEARR